MLIFTGKEKVMLSRCGSKGKERNHKRGKGKLIRTERHINTSGKENEEII